MKVQGTGTTSDVTTSYAQNRVILRSSRAHEQKCATSTSNQASSSLVTMQKIFYLDLKDNLKDLSLTQAYELLFQLEAANPDITFKFRATKQGQIRVEPTEAAVGFFRAEQVVQGKVLKFRERELVVTGTRTVVEGVDPHLPIERITRVTGVIKAERCTNKQTGRPTRQVVVVWEANPPNSIDLGAAGIFQVRPYYPNPVRCYKCQGWGHFARACQGKETCGICSGEHATKTCTQNQQQQTCPNCKGDHPAWSNQCHVYVEAATRIRKQVEKNTSLGYLGKPRRWETDMAPSPSQQTPTAQDFPALPGTSPVPMMQKQVTMATELITLLKTALIAITKKLGIPSQEVEEVFDTCLQEVTSPKKGTPADKAIEKAKRQLTHPEHILMETQQTQDNSRKRALSSHSTVEEPQDTEAATSNTCTKVQILDPLKNSPPPKI